MTATPAAAVGGRPALTPQQRRSAIIAGAVAGGLFGIGWAILGAVTVLLVVFVLLGGLLLMMFGGADITGGLGGVLIGILLVAFAIGAGLVVVAVVVSRRILRRGGVHRATAVTWLALLIVLVIDTIAGRIADPFLAVTDSDVPFATRVVAGLLLVVVAVGAGIGAWLLMAHALRAPAAAPAVGRALPAVRVLDASADLLATWTRDPGAFARMLGTAIPAGWPEFPGGITWAAERLRSHPEEAGWWTHLFLDGATGELVGSGGYKGPPADGVVELGYEIAPAFRRRGYATAATLELARRAFAHAGVQTVLAHTLAEENSSARVLRGAGFAFDGESVDGGTPVWRWRLDRPAAQPA